MSHQPETPFDNIETSHEYVAMLATAIEEARKDVDAEVEIALNENAVRRKDGFQLVAFNLAKLSSHITSSRRILNDLRTLRRLLIQEHSRLHRVATTTRS